MKQGLQLALTPINDCVLVLLDRPAIKEGKYSSRTSGIVTAISNHSHLSKVNYSTASDEWMLNKRVYFEEYKEGGRVKKDGKEYSFIKLEDIRGYEDVA